ncbi:MAG: single-stranded DNA-binding protein [Pirellulales bacterium]
MASYNRVVLVGNLTRDPELRYIPSGTAVSEIGLAINDRFKRNEQWVEETTFVDVTLWARTAEVANEYLSKGSSVLIEGRLKLDTWEKDGQKRSKLRVIGEKMQMLGGRSQGGGAQGEGAQGGGAQRIDQSSAQQQAAPYSQESSAEKTVSGQSVGEQAANSQFVSAPPSDEIPF